jgi:chromate transporter
MVTLIQLFVTFARIGLLAFGGGSATLPLIEREIVTGLQWFTDSEFVELVAISELTPGPIAINAATFVGYKLNGIWGSFIATLGVCLPSITLVLVVARFLQRFEGNIWADRVVRSLRPAVVALIAAAAYSIAGKGIADIWGIVISVASFFILRSRKISPPLILIMAGIAGIIAYS